MRLLNSIGASAILGLLSACATPQINEETVEPQDPSSLRPRIALKEDATAILTIELADVFAIPSSRVRPLGSIPDESPACSSDKDVVSIENLANETGFTPIVNEIAAIQNEIHTGSIRPMCPTDQFAAVISGDLFSLKDFNPNGGVIISRFNNVDLDNAECAVFKEGDLKEAFKIEGNFTAVRSYDLTPRDIERLNELPCYAIQFEPNAGVFEAQPLTQ